MSSQIHDRYKFQSPLDAMAAREKLVLLGIPRGATQAHFLELIVDRGRVNNPRDVDETVKYYRGQLIEVRPELSMSSEQFDYVFDTLDKARDARSAILRITGCRDEKLVDLRAGNMVSMNGAHFFYDQPTESCPCGVDAERPGHKSEWRRIVQEMEALGGMTPQGRSEWLRGKYNDEGRFKEIEREIADQAGRMGGGGVDITKLVMVRFSTPTDTVNAADKLLRMGVPGKAIVKGLDCMLLLNKDDCPQWWDVQTAWAASQGREVTATSDVAAEWVDRGTSGKIELTVAGEDDAKVLYDLFVKQGGVPKDSIDKKDRSLFLDRSQRDRILAMKDELKNVKASVVTKLGRYRFS